MKQLGKYIRPVMVTIVSKRYLRCAKPFPHRLFQLSSLIASYFAGYNSAMIRIVQHTDEDGDAIRRLIYEVAHDLFHDAPTVEETIALYRKDWPLEDLDDIPASFPAHNSLFLLVYDDDKLVGSGAVHHYQDDIAEVSRVWLLPAYQGRKIGYQLMLRLIEFAKSKGYRWLWLETSPDHQQKAVAFYQRLGFKISSKYQSKFADIGMELDLTQAKPLPNIPL